MSNHAIQTSYSLKPAIGFKGMIAKDPSRAVIKAGLSATRKLVSVAVTGATNGETLDIVINGTTFSVTLDGSATVAEAVAALVSEINDGDEPVLASGTTTPLLLESTVDAPYGNDLSDTTAAGRRISGDFSVTESETNLGTPVVLVAQGEEVPFGCFVCKDERSDDGQAVRLPRQSSDVTGLRGEGFVVADFGKSDHSQKYHRNSMVNVMRKGYIFVLVEDAVAKGGAVYVRYAAGAGGTQLGSCRSDDPGSEAALLPSARYETAADAGELAMVEINLV
jgi:hypothetical protein